MAGNFTRAAIEAAPPLARVPARAVQFAGWFVLGVAAFAFELVILALLHQLWRWPLWEASAVAAEIVLFSRFLTTDRLVFGYARPSLQRCWRFHIAAAGSFAVSWIVLNSTASFLHVPYALAAFAGTIASFVWSATTNFLWVWRSSDESRAGT